MPWKSFFFEKNSRGVAGSQRTTQNFGFRFSQTLKSCFVKTATDRILMATFAVPISLLLLAKLILVRWLRIYVPRTRMVRRDPRSAGDLVD